MMTLPLDMIIPLLLSLFAGFIIGIERTTHGHSAGMRTHMLVCLASSLLMVITVHQLEILKNIPIEAIRIDPTRMAQGIMTGIGFLGAGVIIKEGLTIRGLTTAASIWTTSAIGIIIGLGMFVVGSIATLLTLATLTSFRWIERKTPALHYANLTLSSFSRLSKNELILILNPFDITVCSGIDYVWEKNCPKVYRVVVRTKQPERYDDLLFDLLRDEKWVKVELTPANDG